MGSELKKHFKKAICPTEKEMDIRNPDEIRTVFFKHKPKLVIHCAAMTDVSYCEKNPYLCYATNSIGTFNLLTFCIAFESKLVYISTDHVFDGLKGHYSELDIPNPTTHYAQSKLIGEHFTLSDPKNLVIRTSFMKDFPFEKAYVNKYSSLLWIEDAAKQIVKAIKMNLRGTWHIAGKEKSIYDFVKERYPNIEPMKLEERPANNAGIPYLKDTSLNSIKWRNVSKT